MGIASDMRPNSYSQQNTLRLREIFGTNTLACEMDMEAVNLQLGNSTEQWAPPHSGQEYKTANAHLKIKNKRNSSHGTQLHAPNENPTSSQIPSTATRGECARRNFRRSRTDTHTQTHTKRRKDYTSNITFHKK